MYLKAEQLRKLRKITNEIACSGAYGDKNMELQMMNFEKNKVPEWEKEIIIKVWEYKKKLAHDLCKELGGLINGEES